jgi:hypothetical protein
VVKRWCGVVLLWGAALLPDNGQLLVRLVALVVRQNCRHSQQLTEQ